MIWQIVKALAFAAVLIYAAVMDVRTRTIQTRIHVLLFFVGLIGVDASSVWGAFLTFLPMFAGGMLTGGIGGGDIKGAAMCGWVLQGLNGIYAVLTGMVTSLVSMPVIHKIKKEDMRATFPFFPFLALGGIAVQILILII